MQIETLADKARDSLSEYCMGECKAYCCKKGFLVLNLKEADLIAKNNKDALIKDGTLKEIENNKFSLNLNKNSCPSLKDNKCTIYKDRPKTCKEFPIFITEKNIRLSPRCYGIRAGLLYPYIREFKKLGYKLDQL